MIGTGGDGLARRHDAFLVVGTGPGRTHAGNDEGEGLTEKLGVLQLYKEQTTQLQYEFKQKAQRAAEATNEQSAS